MFFFDKPDGETFIFFQIFFLNYFRSAFPFSPTLLRCYKIFFILVVAIPFPLLLLALMIFAFLLDLLDNRNSSPLQWLDHILAFLIIFWSPFRNRRKAYHYLEWLKPLCKHKITKLFFFSLVFFNSALACLYFFLDDFNLMW